MFAAINAWTLPRGLEPAEQLAVAGAAGFGGIELTVGPDEPLTFETPPAQFAELARRAVELGLEITSLASTVFWQTNYGAADPQVRRQARELTVRMLDQAAAAGAGAILVVPAVVGEAGEPRPRVGYADAMHRSLQALRELRHEAEQRAVCIALENVANRFLLSPLEAAELIDRVNSPYVGWYFDVGNAVSIGYPEDWIATLGGRIRRVHVKDWRQTAAGGECCVLGEGIVDWPRVAAALRQAGYDGPLVYEGPGEPQIIRRRMEALLTLPGAPRAEEQS